MPRTMQVAIDPRHGLIFLTDQEDQPTEDWLRHQNQFYKKGCKWYTAYPFSGGAISVQKECLAKHFRPVHEMDIDIATETDGYNPAKQTILDIWAEMNGKTA